MGNAVGGIAVGFAIAMMLIGLTWAAWRVAVAFRLEWRRRYPERVDPASGQTERTLDEHYRWVRESHWAEGGRPTMPIEYHRQRDEEWARAGEEAEWKRVEAEKAAAIARGEEIFGPAVPTPIDPMVDQWQTRRRIEMATKWWQANYNADGTPRGPTDSQSDARRYYEEGLI